MSVEARCVEIPKRCMQVRTCKRLQRAAIWPENEFVSEVQVGPGAAGEFVQRVRYGCLVAGEQSPDDVAR